MASIGIVAAAVTIVGLVSVPIQGASLGPSYFTDCTGRYAGSSTTAGSTYTAWGALWNDTLANGSLTLSGQGARSNSSVLTPSVHSFGWIRVGPGPVNGVCLTPRGIPSHVHFSFSNLTYTIQLEANCTGSSFAAGAEYGLVLVGNIYDATTHQRVWTSNLTTGVAAKVVTCALGHSVSYLHTFRFHHDFTVIGANVTLSPSDQYSFFAGARASTYAWGGSGNSSRTAYGIATISTLSTTLSHVSCPRC
jgi:hypothetical protein